MKWKPIELVKLYDYINSSQLEMTGEYWNLWELVKIDPIKWTEKIYGKLGGGFWVVGICGNFVIWYNDIENGFNISRYKKYGEISEYWCNQDELHHTIYRLYQIIKFGGDIIGQAGPPESLS